MTAAANGDAPERAEELYHNVTCPFCGLLCDDLEVARTGSALKVTKNGCPRSTGWFQRTLPAAKPMVRGQEVSLEEAIKAAAALIKESKLPLYGGLATDVDGARAAISLADKSCGVIDHALSEGAYRNYRVLQTSGWVMSTLTETRNRADLIVIVGSDVDKAHGRFFERIVNAPDTMFESLAAKRTVVFIGEGMNTAAAKGSRIGDVISIECPTANLMEVMGVLQARLRDHNVQATESPAQKRGFLSSLLPTSRGAEQSAEVAGVKLADIDALVKLFKAAKYGVMVWAPPGLNFPQADLAVHLISDIIKDLNVEGRFAGLSLGGAEGATSLASVAAWQTGYPGRVSFADGSPKYDTYRNSIGRMLAEKEGDLLLWLASFTTDLGPPTTNLPTIVLGTPGLRLSQPPTVFIPVGTPGVDHAGTLVRCDSVVSLPLKNLGRSRLPRAADVLAAVESAL